MAWLQRKDAEQHTITTTTTKPQAEGEGEEGGGLSSTPSAVVVRLPRRSTPQASVSFSSHDPGDQASKNLWQVYALGGFMVVRWLWARWRERRASRRFSGAAEDDDYED